MTARKTSIQSGPFTVGMELEYWLANPKTRKPANVDSSFVQELKNRLGEKRAANELQKCVAEMTTKPCSKIQELETELNQIRSGLFKLSEEYGVAPVAVSTFPGASPQDMVLTPNPRYQNIREKIVFLPTST